MHTTLPSVTSLDVVRALAAPDAPALLDIRLPDDVLSHPGTILTAVPVAYDDVATQADLARAHGAILICHKGLKLSAGATARLLNRKLPAWNLRGGQVAWQSAGLPLQGATPPKTIALALDATPTEVAAAWAILRFVAPRAELLEVPRSDLEGVGEKFTATRPVASDAPDLPGLAALLDEASHPQSLFQDQLIGAGPRPSSAFPCLDAAYRGRLDTSPPRRPATNPVSKDAEAAA